MQKKINPKLIHKDLTVHNEHNLQFELINRINLTLDTKKEKNNA